MVKCLAPAVALLIHAVLATAAAHHDKPHHPDKPHPDKPHPNPPHHTKAAHHKPTPIHPATEPTAKPGTGCKVTSFQDIANAVSSCSDIILSNIAAPSGGTIDLQNLKNGARVTFDGTTTFAKTADDNFDPIIISGTNIVISGAPGHVIDGNGPAYWDGKGSNGGVPKPDHFIVVKKTSNARITGLNIKNWPVHCFSMTGNTNLYVSGLNLDNSAGDAPVGSSRNVSAAHNSDGFDISSSQSVTLADIRVYNQDDCVAITSGNNITVTRIDCFHGHGISIGSLGGKADNVVNNVLFSDIRISDSLNGCRIKTNYKTSGSATNIVFKDITLSGITLYGIDVQQDYLNGGPTGIPTNGVQVSGVRFINVQGTATGPSAYNYYILCGSGSCSDFTFQNTKITGGGMGAKCNYPPGGCPG